MFFFMTAKNKIMSFPFQTDTDFTVPCLFVFIEGQMKINGIEGQVIRSQFWVLPMFS